MLALSYEKVMKGDCPVRFTRLSRADFDDMSEIVMHHVFASRNDLGRICDEPVFNNDIAGRLSRAGLGTVTKQLPIKVRLRDFAKTYYLDLVVNNAFVAEFKTLQALIKRNESQLLNYLFIAEVPHGKLINLRPPEIEFRTVNAAVSAKERRHFQMHNDEWMPLTARCRLMAETVDDCLSAWGAFLDFKLYEEAVVHFLGGEETVCRRVELKRQGLVLGTQTISVVSNEIGFTLTGLPPKARLDHEAHLRRFLALTPLKALQWVNFHHNDIHLKTLKVQ